MEFHLPDFDDAMFWIGAFAVVFSIGWFILEAVRKRRNKKARSRFEQDQKIVEDITKKEDL